MAQTLADVVFRRTGLGSAGYPGTDVLTACAQAMAEKLGWDSGRVQRRCRALQSDIQWLPVLWHDGVGCKTPEEEHRLCQTTTDIIKEYWTVNLHDMAKVRHAIGTRGFFKDLDEYHFGKQWHLAKVVNYSVMRETGPGPGLRGRD